MPLIEENDFLMTPSEVSKMLSVNVDTVRAWCKRGIVPYYRVGPRGDRRLKYSDVMKLLKDNKEEEL